MRITFPVANNLPSSYFHRKCARFFLDNSHRLVFILYANTDTVRRECYGIVCCVVVLCVADIVVFAKETEKECIIYTESSQCFHHHIIRCITIFFQFVILVFSQFIVRIKIFAAPNHTNNNELFEYFRCCCCFVNIFPFFFRLLSRRYFCIETTNPL